MKSFIALQARKVAIPSEVSHEYLPMSTTSQAKKAEAIAQSINNKAEAKAESSETKLVAAPFKSGSQSRPKELAYKESGDLYSGLRWLLPGLAFMFIIHYLSKYLEHLFIREQ